jgi:hypothetical protein
MKGSVTFKSSAGRCCGATHNQSQPKQCRIRHCCVTPHISTRQVTYLPIGVLLFLAESKKGAQNCKSFLLYHHDACFHSFARIKGYTSAAALTNTIRRCKHCICDGRQLKLYGISHVLCCATSTWTLCISAGSIGWLCLAFVLLRTC